MAKSVYILIEIGVMTYGNNEQCCFLDKLRITKTVLSSSNRLSCVCDFLVLQLCLCDVTSVPVQGKKHIGRG
jgi:hypothetical protein